MQNTYDKIKYIKETVLGIREKYLKQNPDNPDLSGECINISIEIYNELKNKFICTDIHGEIFNYRVPSEYWGYQHHLLSIYIDDGSELWIDATAGQFKPFFNVDDIIISTKKPYWFFEDDKNIFLDINRITKNKRFKFYKIKRKLTIAEYIQYIILGKISDFFYGKLNNKYRYVYNNLI